MGCGLRALVPDPSWALVGPVGRGGSGQSHGLSMPSGWQLRECRLWHACVRQTYLDFETAAAAACGRNLRVASGVRMVRLCREHQGQEQGHAGA